MATEKYTVELCNYEICLAFDLLVTGIEDDNKAASLSGLKRLQDVITKLALGCTFIENTEDLRKELGIANHE